jgi:predicted amidohydrolase
MKNLSISAIQTNLFWEDKKANLDYLEKKIAALPQNQDLIILPEMFTTGFSMNPEKLAEKPNGPTFNWLQQKAKQSNAAITGSYIVQDQDRYYNRLVWMLPNGQFYTYDKKHLFSLSEEPKHYTAGEKKLIIDYKGWRICPLICYDLRFPVWSRNRENYDLLIYVANWPEKRAHHWRSLLMARAIENQAYTIGVNRIGYDGNQLYHSGNTSIIDYAGNILHHMSHVEGIANIELDCAPQQAFRKQFRFLADQDDFVIK